MKHILCAAGAITDLQTNVTFRAHTDARSGLVMGIATVSDTIADHYEGRIGYRILSKEELDQVMGLAPAASPVQMLLEETNAPAAEVPTP